MRLFLLAFVLLVIAGFPSRSQEVDTTELKKKLDSQIADSLKVNVMNELAMAYFNSEPVKTRNYASAALEISERIGYRKGMADSYYSLSLLSRLAGEYSEELQLLYKSLPIYESITDTVAIARTYNAIAFLNYQVDDYENARIFYSKSIEILRGKKDPRVVSRTYRGMGVVEFAVANYDESLAMYRLSLELERKSNSEEGIANCYNNIGIVFTARSQYDSALYYLDRALLLQKRNNNNNRLPAAYHNLADVYYRMGQLEKSLSMLRLGLPIAQKYGNTPAIVEATELMAEIYEQLGDYKNAFNYLKLRDDARDKVLNREQSLRIENLKSINTLQQKEKEIALLRKEHEIGDLRNKFTWAGFSVLFVVLGSIVYFVINKLKKDSLIRAAREKIMEAELRNKELVEKELQQDLEFRNKELVTHALNLVQKNSHLENMRAEIEEIAKIVDAEAKQKLSRLVKTINYSLETEKEWSEFRMYFEKVHSSFFDRIRSDHPELTQTDLKLCALISLNLSLKDTSELMAVSAESVKMARHRLKKKLNLSAEEDLTEYIAHYKFQNASQTTDRVNN